MSWTTMRGGLVAAALFSAVGASAQTTNAWVPVSGANDWNTAGNWNPATVPNADTHVAIFTNDYAAHVTNRLSANVTLNRLLFNDAGAGDNNLLVIESNQIAFAGISPSIVNSNEYSGQLSIYSTVRVDGVTLTLGGRGDSGWMNFRGPVVGNGTILTIKNNLQFFGANSNFTGSIIASNNVGGGIQSVYGNASYWAFGDTNGATYVYGNSAVRPLGQGSSGASNAEPVHLYGSSTYGSLGFQGIVNSKYLGAVTLHTNSTIGISGPQGAGAGSQGVLFFGGTLMDDGSGRGVHFLQDLVQSGNGTGVLSRTSRLAFGGVGTYGGFTHLTANRNPDDSGTFDMYLQLTNGNDRLPVGTTMFLGGITNAGLGDIGRVGANGILVLAGANQEMAGLYTLGTGSQNRVVGGVPTNNTLTLNIAAGRTNLYGGYLGGAGVNENNLALTKKGDGLLNLTNVNTFAGPTTVEAGTLRIGGAHSGGGAATVQSGGTLKIAGSFAGATTVQSGGLLSVDGTHTTGLITVDNGGTLGGIGTVGAVTSAGTVSPGNSVGTLTANGNVTLSAGATLQIEINEFLGDDYDKLIISGGMLSLSGSPDLAISLNYTPGMGDAFTIVSGMTGFDPGIDGTFSGKPDLGTFDVSGTTFQIDYTPTEITVTVVPEPHTLGLLGLAALGGLLRRRIRG